MVLYAQHRLIGVITTAVSPAVIQKGNASFIVTSIGKTFQFYDCQKLQLLFTGPEYPNTISKLFCHDKFIFAVFDDFISISHRSEKTQRLELAGNSPVMYVEVLGGFLHVLQANGTLSLFEVERNYELLSRITVCENGNRIMHGSHPITYLNKLIILDSENNLFLYNFKTRKIIYNYTCISKVSNIAIIVHSPVLDIVAICYENGIIDFVHLKDDKILAQFNTEISKVSSLSFRTDGQGHMAIGTNNGDIFIWDLESKALLQKIRSAHEQQIHFLHFLPGQPVLLSVSSDNSIKEWIFEGMEQSPRLLRHRSGHCDIPNVIGFYGVNSHYILSASLDRSLRKFSSFKDAQSLEFAQGSMSKLQEQENLDILGTSKQLIIIGLSWSLTRQKDWDNMLSCHQNCNYALSWNYERSALGSHKFFSKDKSDVTCVAVSPCGHFGILGCKTGQIDVFNMQSGIFQYSIKANEQFAILSLAVALGSQRLISLTSNGLISTWSMNPRRTAIQSQNLGTSATLLRLHQESGMIAVALTSGNIIVLDLDTWQIARRFSGHLGNVADLTFSDDGKWLISCGDDSDRSFCTWDLVSGQLLDRQLLEGVPKGIALSPTNDFLATISDASVGIQLWANLSFYKTFSTDPYAEDDVSSHHDIEAALMQYVQKESFVSLSDIHAIYWQKLLNLDLIKEKNKPVEPPKAPVKSPFFLDFSSSGQNHLAPKNDGNLVDIGGKINGMVGTKTLKSAFTVALQEMDNWEFHNYVKTLSASSVDFELRNLSHDFDSLVKFLQYLVLQLQRKTDFDLVQTYLYIILSTCEEALIESDECKAFLKQLQSLQDSTWLSLERKFQESLCFISFTKS